MYDFAHQFPTISRPSVVACTLSTRASSYPIISMKIGLMNPHPALASRCHSTRQFPARASSGKRRKPRSLSRQPLRGGGMARCCKKAAARQTHYRRGRKRIMGVVYSCTRSPRVVARILLAQRSHSPSIPRQAPSVTLDHVTRSSVPSSRLLRLAPSAPTTS